MLPIISAKIAAVVGFACLDTEAGCDILKFRMSTQKKEEIQKEENFNNSKNRTKTEIWGIEYQFGIL